MFPQCSPFYSRELPTIRMVNVCRPSNAALPSPNRRRSCLLEARYVVLFYKLFCINTLMISIPNRSRILRGHGEEKETFRITTP